MKENKLALNQAESEKFLRAIITIKNALTDDLNYFSIS